MKYFNSGVKCQFINPDTQTLLMVEPEVNLNIFEWVKENRYLLEEYLIKYNGVLLRNFGIYAVSEFNKVVQIICPNLLDYVYRSTPRTRSRSAPTKNLRSALTKSCRCLGVRAFSRKCVFANSFI